MNLEDIELFLALVKNELNFSRTAESLNGIDQPNLGRHIRQLEKDLGYPKLPCILIDRRQRRLTSAGEVFNKDAVEIVRLLKQAKERAFRASRGEDIGQLVIAVNSSITNSVLPAVLQTFRSQRPDVKLVLCESPPQHQIQQLLNYQIDIAFNYLPLDDHPDLICVPILQEPLVIALSESHRLADESQIPLKALANESFVLPSPDIVHFYQQIIDFCKQVFGREPEIVQEATWMLTVLSLVAGGVGVSLLLKNAQNIQRQGVVYRLIKGIEGDKLKIQTVALMRRNDQSAVLNEFIEIVKNIV
jgi:DNA-binding transcriptional LysR family regulator